MKRFVPSILSIFFILWIGVVLYPYFKVHYSYLALFLSKNHPLEKLYIFFILALFSYALGRRIFRLFRFKFYSLLEEFVFASGVGWAILKYGSMILNLFPANYGWGLTVGILLLFALELFPIVRIILSKIKFVLGLKFTALNIILGVLLGITIFFTLSISLASDLSDMSDLSLGRLFHFYFGILTIMGMLALIKRYFHSESGLLAGCLFYINGLVIFLSERGREELWLALCEFLAIYSLLSWVSSRKISWIVLMVIQIIFALGCEVGPLPKVCGIYWLIGLLPISAVLVSHFISTYLKQYILLKRVIMGMIIGVFILTLSYEGYVIFNYRAPLKFIYGLEDAQEYIARNKDIGFFPKRR